MKSLSLVLFCLLASSAIGGPFDWLKAVGRSVSHPAKHETPHRTRAGTSHSAAARKPKPEPTVANTPGVLRSESPQPGDRQAPVAREESAPSPQRPIATPPPLTGAAPGDLPYGVPVAGKPGMVISPYSPNGGYVDVRDLPSGIPVKDPYTGKIFLTP